MPLILPPLSRHSLTTFTLPKQVKEARAFVRPSDWFAKQLQEYATEQGAKQAEEQVEDKFTAKKRKEIEEEKALLQKAVNLQKKKNLWDSKAEESQKQQLNDQLVKEKLMANKLRNNPAAYEADDQNGPRKLTSLMSLFQQKPADDSANRPVNKVVLNKAPAKKWAPVSTPHLQRTVKPETKNYDFYKRAKSREFKKQESLRKSKSKLNCDPPKNAANCDLNNNSIKNTSSLSKAAPPPPPPPPPVKPVVNSVKPAVNTVKRTPVAAAPPPPPPPPPAAIVKPAIPASKPIGQPSANRVTSPVPSINSKTSSPMQSSANSRVSSPQPSSNTSSRISSPTPPNNSTLINRTTVPSSPSVAQSKLDPFIMNKFNKQNDRNQFCIDYGSKLNSAQKKPVEPPTPQVVRNIPIKLEPAEPAKEEPEEEVVELEAEEEEETSEEESSEEESEEGELGHLGDIVGESNITKLPSESKIN